MPRSTISVRSAIASKMRSSTIAVCTMQSGSRAKSASLSSVAATPSSRPRPASSPASLPTFSGLDTQTPTSSRSGRASMPAIACRPTVPVDQATTLLMSAPIRTPSPAAGHEVGQAEVEVRHLQAAVDLEHLAGHEPTGGAGQVEHRRRDVLDLTDPRQRRLRGHLVHGRLVAGDELQGTGHHTAHGDGVDPDRRAEVLGGQPRVVGQRRLRGAVGEVAASGDPADDAGDVDDGATVVLEHLRHRGPGERMGGGDVEVERLLEVAGVGVEQGVGNRAADVVHHDVEAPELVVRRVREVGHRLEIHQVGRDDDGPGDRAPRCPWPPARAGRHCARRGRRRLPPRRARWRSRHRFLVRRP